MAFACLIFGLGNSNFKSFLVNVALPLATCLLLIRFVYGLLKQIQIRVLNTFKQIIVGLKLFDLDFSVSFNGKDLVIR